MFQAQVDQESRLEWQMVSDGLRSVDDPSYADDIFTVMKIHVNELSLYIVLERRTHPKVHDSSGLVATLH